MEKIACRLIFLAFSVAESFYIKNLLNEVFLNNFLELKKYIHIFFIIIQKNNITEDIFIYFIPITVFIN